ncbi:hypothetical protein GXP70_25560 [Paenibacillus lycopersici]|uniref:SLH domain-containing protein n=1 Tax=Paenibacillus lycopersici TaxID=2704462 RepID=A0A6C0G6D5_9BACL|nr:X2-like carbohydrate binding domain-containing protein [Paenibacillus lycopersici]QHT63000.1 hypothetical protein GXP70_25560 [Paenibacillus lycopersici]
MNRYKWTRKFLAAFLSIAMVLGFMPAMERASAATPTVKVVQIAAAKDNSIALKSDGTVIAWGKQVTTWAKPPEGLTDVVEIYAKDTVFLARKSNGTIVAWGSNEATELNIPAGLGKVVSMASAGNHTLVVSELGAISGVGRAIGWGLNGNGQSTVPVDAQSSATKVAAGTYYSMALKFNGTVVAWGSNGAGAMPMPSDLSNVIAIDAGYRYALALKSDGTVVAWGQEYSGNGILDVAGLTGIKAISANQEHAVALKNDGTVVGWGNNSDGKATPPAGLSDVVAVSAGVNHSLALKSDGTVVSWGSQTSVPDNNELSSLTIAEGTPNPVFSSAVTSYQYDIDPNETSVHINAVLKDTAYSALYINDQLQKSGTTVAVAVPAIGAVIKVKVVPYLKPQQAQTYTLKVTRDRVAPAVAFTPNGNTAALKSVETTVRVTDATSGIDTSTLKYAWTQSASAPASGDWTSFALQTADSKQFAYTGSDGEWYLHIRAEDHAGNTMEATSASFLIDGTPPELSVTMKNEDDNSYPESTTDGWSNQSVTLTAAATDEISASVPIQYTLDGGKTWGNYSGEITLEVDGIYTVGFQAQDTAGNTTIVNRTVKIAKRSLKMTLTLTNNATGTAYTSGEWVDTGVSVKAIAETTTGSALTYTYSLKIGNVEVMTDEPYYPDSTNVGFIEDGMNSGDFTVSDGANTLNVPYAINIDKKSPTVSFSPNGNATAAKAVSVTVNVEDVGGSGVADSTLKYVWTQSTEEPAGGWLPLNNGSTLTKEGVDGTWYLHIQGQDLLGHTACRDDDDRCINRSTSVTHVASDAFELMNEALDSTLSMTAANFDKKESAQADIMTEMMLNGNTLTGISNGGTTLAEETDYTVGGNSVTILKSYLASQPEGITSLTFTFSGGAAPTLEITISDTTPSNSAISPDIASFDQNPSAQTDVVTMLALNGNTLAGISNGDTELVSGTDYIVEDDRVTILKSYLAVQPPGITSLTFTFSAGEIQTLILMVSDTTSSNSTISPNSGSFDKTASAQADVVTTLSLNGNTLEKISNGGTPLVSGTDYTVSDDGDTVTILKDYLATQPEGATSLTFTFSAGADQTLTITVTDTRVREGTPTIAIDYAKEELTGFEAGGSYTIDGTLVFPIDGKLDVADYLGDALAIVKKGNGTTTDSVAQNLVVPSRPAAPTAAGVDPTMVGGTGKITGVTTAMEYKSSIGAWTGVTGTEINGLGIGTYEVRIKATATSFKSVEQTVTITALTPEAEATPTIAIDYANEELTGFEAGGSYTIDGTLVFPIDGKLDVAGYLGDALAIVKKGNGTTTDSVAQNLVVPSRPAAPTAAGVNPTMVGGTGKITGVTTAMEYKSSIGAWTGVTGTEINGLGIGTYEVRIKATATSFKSVEQTVTITDPLPATTYTMTVNNGGDGASGSRKYASGDTVSIQAGTRSGYSFNGWTSSDGAIFANASDADTTFVMPAHNVTVTANWRANGGSGGWSFPTAPTGPVVTIDKKIDQPTTVSTSLTASVNPNSHASVNITESQIRTLIEAAKRDAQNKGNTADGIGIAFHILFSEDVTSFSVKLGESALALLEKENVKRFDLNSSLVDFSFDQAAIREMEFQALRDLVIEAAPVSELSDEARQLIGGRPVFDLTVSYENDGKTEYVTNFEKGTVTLGIAYKADSGEKTANLYTVHVDKEGKPKFLSRSSYDNGKLTFSRNSLSVYGVGYLPPAPAFSDTVKHWAKDGIDFVVSFGLIAGTSETTFSPNTAITRGDFLMALGKLSGADTSGYKQSSFSDVSSTSSAMPYIEWAAQNKIVQGVGNTRFNPDRSITREQIAVITAGFAQAMGYTLPANKQAVTFADETEISIWAKDAVKAIQQAGVVEGKDNNRYDPAGNATRAEAAIILRRFMELVMVGA